MKKIVEIENLDIEKNKEFEKLIKEVLKVCFETEKIKNENLYISVTLTNPQNIKKINSKYRNIDKETDVLSFPMFEKDELKDIINKTNQEEVLGDIVISIERVKKQAEEYGHSSERELAYMVVHGFYHLMGEDHIEDNDKRQMRQKEEFVLEKLKITR